MASKTVIRPNKNYPHIDENQPASLKDIFKSLLRFKRTKEIVCIATSIHEKNREMVQY